MTAFSPSCLIDTLWAKEYDVWTSSDIIEVIAGLEEMLEKKVKEEENGS